jgi:hypothetical protein
MPDPLLYLQAMGAAALVSALLVLAISRRRQEVGPTQQQRASILGLAGGLVAGYCVLGIRPAIPPLNALDRLLAIVLPLIFAIELLALWPRVPKRLAWWLRISLALLVPRMLLHDSIHLSQRTTWEAIATLLVCGVLAATVWALLALLARRSPGVAIPLSLVMSIQAAGVAILLGGYIKGGVASLPAVAAIVAVTLVSRASVKSMDSQAVLGVGVMSLFGLLMIGRFFGGLGTVAAIAIFLAPLLCWITELPLLRRRPQWFIVAVQLLLVAIPLAIVLGLAKMRFDQETAPLL